MTRAHSHRRHSGSGETLPRGNHGRLAVDASLRFVRHWVGKNGLRFHVGLLQAALAHGAVDATPVRAISTDERFQLMGHNAVAPPGVAKQSGGIAHTRLRCARLSAQSGSPAG
jgi:hypothetical protein